MIQLEASAVAEVAIGAFLRLLEVQGREPVPWECQQLIVALSAFGKRDYREALCRLGNALATVREREEIEELCLDYHPRREILQIIFNDLRGVRAGLH